MRLPANWARLGTFSLAEGTIFGELVLDGPRTNLHLHDENFFESRAINRGTLTGRLFDLTKVTLIDCLSAGTGSYLNGPYFADVHPHYVVYGGAHLDPKSKCISDLRFEIDDAKALFYDFDAFGTLWDAHALMGQVGDAVVASMRRSLPDATPRPLVTGPDAIITYFAGRRTIVTVPTELGTVCASHNPNSSFGGPEGVAIQNTITVTMTFQEPVAFDDAQSRLHVLLRFFELLIGRRQNLLALTAHTVGEDDQSFPLNVYWSSPPQRNDAHGVSEPHPADVLLSPVDQPGTFVSVLQNWLGRDGSWQDARERFSSCFANQNVYDVDRLIGAANMFDILPASAVPPDVDMPDDVMEANRKCREIWKPLPASPERDSVLGALGRVGKSTLKRRIRHRAGPILNAAGDWFPDLLMVLDDAVDCRNHYVHGSPALCDYAKHFFDTVVFLTKSLEFVFGASDLVEAGWDLSAWGRRATSLSHPFSDYRNGYRDRLAALRKVCGNA